MHTSCNPARNNLQALCSLKLQHSHLPPLLLLCCLSCPGPILCVPAKRLGANKRDLVLTGSWCWP
jgi:hypothetical protein